MSRDEAAIEQEIQDKGLNAPRLTPAQIDGVIAHEAYHVFPGTTLTVCALTLKNGFIVTGTSAAASPENFDEALGRKIARENARNRIWELEGYLLRERLAHGDRMGKLNDVLNTAKTPGNAQANDYLHGMANGLILADAIMRDVEPDYVIRRVLDSTEGPAVDPADTQSPIG